MKDWTDADDLTATPEDDGAGLRIVALVAVVALVVTMALLMAWPFLLAAFR